MGEKVVYCKGQWLPRSRAMLSVEERGFRFGDGVFETVAVYAGVPYQWERHMARLERGLAVLKIPTPEEDLWRCGVRLLQTNDLVRGFLRISVSRGIGSRGYLPVSAAPGSPTVVLETVEARPRLEASVRLWSSSFTRPLASALPAGIKTMQGLNATLARLEAEERGCGEALLCTPDGVLCEGSSSNLFWLREGTLYTPSLECPLVAGTTRDAVLRLSPFPVKEGSFAWTALEGAEEVFLTNVAWGIAPVSSLEPAGWSWSQRTHTQALEALLRQDIERYVAAKQSELDRAAGAGEGDP